MVANLTLGPDVSRERDNTASSELAITLDVGPVAAHGPAALIGADGKPPSDEFPITNALVGLRKQLFAVDHDPPCFGLGEPKKDKLTLQFDVKTLTNGTVKATIFSVANLSVSGGKTNERKNTIVVNFQICDKPTLSNAKPPKPPLAADAGATPGKVAQPLSPEERGELGLPMVR